MVTIAAVALILAIFPTVITSDIGVAFAHSCHNGEHDHDENDNDNSGNGNSNEAEQEIHRNNHQYKTARLYLVKILSDQEIMLAYSLMTI